MSGYVPGDLMTRYYEQRASEGGLMITEATFTSPTGNGGYASPGAGLAGRSRCSRHWCRYWWGKVRPINSELALCNADAVAPCRLPYLQSMPPAYEVFFCNASRTSVDPLLTPSGLLPGAEAISRGTIPSAMRGRVAHD
jgi:hypothetical protein